MAQALITGKIIMINKEKLLMVSVIPAKHTSKPQDHNDVTILGKNV